MKRIVLDAEDFQTLVGGGIVDKDGTKIILSDIGYHEMVSSIHWATMYRTPNSVPSA